MRWWFSVRGLEHPEGIAFAAAISTYVADLDQQIMQAEAAVARCRPTLEQESAHQAKMA
jgi:hypothetical protein